jgi:uncharacterized protein (UPF0261 family)
MPTVLVIGTLDTKGPESNYLAQRIRDFGCQTLILDSGILGEADGVKPDITRQQVAIAAGSTIDTLRNVGSRGKAVEEMLKGVRKVARDLHAEGKIHGLISLGGAEGGVLASAAMQALPLGIPKLIVSPMASGKRHFETFIGTKDIFVMHSVVDILGLNVISIPVFDTAAAAIAGMAKDFATRDANTIKKLIGGRKQIAATMLGNTTRPLMWIKKQIEPKGFDLSLFHANGVGGPAMEEQVESGMLNGLIDYTLSEIIGTLAGGFMNAPATRMEVAGKVGIPQIIVPGCIDFMVLGAPKDIPENLRGRPSYYHNPEYTLVRASESEQLECARIIARKLNPAKGKVVLMVPLRGLSIPNIEKNAQGKQGEFWAPEIDAKFRTELKKHLSKEIQYVEVDAHINDEMFAKAVLETALKLFS